MRILVSAGEPSGDRHAAEVVRTLRAAAPDIEVVATAGPATERAGAASLAPLAREAVVGFAEVLRHLPRLARIRGATVEIFRRRAVDLFLPVDYPGYHLHLAAAARRAGVRVLAYVAPQVWAWAPRRAERLPDLCDGLAVILDFEEDLLRRHGADARFVGHPLLDAPPPRPRAEVRREIGADGAPVVALLPGARPAEVARHLPAFLEAGRILERRGALAVVSLAGDAAPPVGLRVHRGPARDLLAAADAAIAKSGTAALEAAIAGTPVVVAYRTSAASYAIARRLVRLPWIAMPNVILGRRAVPELVQAEATPENLAAEASALLDRPDRREEVRRALADVRARLGRPGAAARVAAWALDLLGRTSEADGVRAAAGPARA